VVTETGRLVLLARAIPIRPDPLEIARRLAGRGDNVGLALLHAAERGGAFARWSFVASHPEASSDALDPLATDEVPPAPAGSPWSWVPRWIGLVPYEHRRSLERPAWTPVERRPAPAMTLPIWRRYGAVVAVDHVEGRVFIVGTRASSIDEIARALSAPAPRRPTGVRLEATDAEPGSVHVERIAAAQELIRRGDLYQVNLARPIALRLRGASRLGALEALEVHERLVRAAPTPLASCLSLDRITVLSTSPELLLYAGAGVLETGAHPPRFGALLTAPIKGTRPRGADAESDAAMAAALDADPKERAELTMIVDVERHDLGRVAAPGSVRVVAGPRVVTHRTVHHREAWIAARAAACASRDDVLASMLPSGSVTGAPKVRAMEVIASLEGRRRGLYTGAIGFVAHDGSTTLAMAIRTATFAGEEGEYLTGGGIVSDSDPRRELEETRWKALQLERIAAVG